MSSIEWSDAQLRILIDERKQRNVEYHTTPNKKKRFFWEDIAEKINEQENTNFFMGDDCHKKFLSLTKAYYTVEKYKKGTGTKRSLVGEEFYKEFSSKFWLNPEQAHNGGNRRSSRASSSTSPATASKTPRAIPSSNVSRSTTFAISRSVTPPTIPFFSQNANVINITINYPGAQEED